MVTARTDIPQRTDIEAPINYRQNRHVLFGEQEGKCNGCQMEFPFKMFEVDHMVPPQPWRYRPQEQPATAVQSVQPNQRRPAHGIPDGAACRVRAAGLRWRPWRRLRGGAVLAFARLVDLVVV